jgi:hypothetical protein
MKYDACYMLRSMLFGCDNLTITYPEWYQLTSRLHATTLAEILLHACDNLEPCTFLSLQFWSYDFLWTV